MPTRGTAGRKAAGDFCDPETGELTVEGMNLVRRAAGLGLTLKGIAALLGMTDRTLQERRKQYPEIDEVFEIGRVEADLAVSDALFKKARNGDMAAIRWYEMTRTGRNPNLPVIESDAGTESFVIQAPAKASLSDWTDEYSPKVIDHDSGAEVA